MPRPPLTSIAVDQLAKYFGAISDASFIDRTWEINSFSGKKGNRELIASGSTIGQNFDYYSGLQKSDLGSTNGTEQSKLLSDLINGSVSFSSLTLPLSSDYAEEFEFFKSDKDLSELSILTSGVNVKIEKISNSSQWNRKADKVYAINVMNPYLGPSTRDTGATEIFANAIPTIELSKCVPYINIDLISLFKTEKAAPTMSLIGFLNPKSLSSVDQSMINAQKTDVRSEASFLGSGYKAGIELFLMPQTLTNQGETASTYAPVIDRMRPLMSLKGLNLSTKTQGGFLSFTSGKLELVLHDRSRMRDIAPFIRPDLYGTTFLDITYGWSHPEGDSKSDNSFGIFLNSLKNESRYRISNSTYSFEEGGQVNISLSIQTVGSIDLLYLGPKNSADVNALNEIFRKLNERISEIKQRAPAASMDSLNFIRGIEDPYSVTKNSFDPEFVKKIKEALKKAKDNDIKNLLTKLVGAGGSGGVIDVAKKSSIKGYTDILNHVSNYSNRGADTISSKFTKDNFSRLYYDENNPDLDEKQKSYFSYGDFFMNYVAAPIARSGNYDEIQVIFYPFNKHAGAVHDLPISCFPINSERFVKMINQLVEKTPEISIRALLNSVNDRFTGFMADRNYLIADQYDQVEADKGEVKEKKTKSRGAEVQVKNGEKTLLEERTLKADIPELKIKPAVVQVFVEGSKLYGSDGNPIIEDGKTLSLIKIHVYDAAMDPHSTLIDILGSARDNQLDLIRIPIADYNASKADNTKKSAAIEAVKVAVNAGLLQSITAQEQVLSDDELINNVMNDSFQKLKILRLKGDYDSLKKLVSAGMPTITYGSSTSIISNASLSSNSSAGLGNVLMQRAFTEPASVSADNIGSGPPMQIIPATLSMTTVGCPLFYPMQRFFIDFGTGTSIDNIYAVISIDSKISKDGYTSDIKFGLADGWAASRSLNQNLALMLLSLQDETQILAAPAATSNSNSTSSDLPRTEFIEAWFYALLVGALVPVVEVKIEVEERIREEIEKIQLKIAAKIEEQKQKAIQKIEAAIPEAVKKAVETAKEKKVEVEYKIQQAQIIAAKIAYLTQLASMIPEIAAQIGDEAAQKLKAETETALAEAEAQAEENRRAENENG